MNYGVFVEDFLKEMSIVPFNIDILKNYQLDLSEGKKAKIDEVGIRKVIIVHRYQTINPVGIPLLVESGFYNIQIKGKKKVWIIRWAIGEDNIREINKISFSRVKNKKTGSVLFYDREMDRDKLKRIWLRSKY